jgi:hypothetical protein
VFSQEEYYQTNKDKISRKRKTRYRKDRSHRDRIRLKAHDYYHQFKKEDHIADRHVMVAEGGRRLYTIGRIATLIRRNIGTVRKYHRLGILPEPSHYDTRGWRLYSREQAVILQLVFRRLDADEIKSLDEVRNEIRSRWR